MRICILNVFHEPYDKRMFHKIGQTLVKAGYEVVSVCPTAQPIPDERDGVHFIPLPFVRTRWERLRAVPRLVRRAWPVRADVYIAPEPESWVAALCLKCCRGGRVVFDMHEHVSTKFSAYFPKLLRRFVEVVTRRVMRLMARATDLIILTRESFREVWKNVATPQIVVTNTARLRPPCTEIPQRLRERYEGKPVLIHQGVFGDIRGSYQLLEAMVHIVKAVPEVRVILLGEYVYGDEKAYRRAVAEAGLDAHFDFCGVVPFEEVPAYIAVAQVGLILLQPGIENHRLAMPHKLFDYMREGKPVIAPAFSVEVARIVREADCGLLVDVTNPKAIADAAITLLTDPAYAQRLGQNGRRAVEETYNWEKEESVLLEALQRLTPG